MTSSSSTTRRTQLWRANSTTSRKIRSGSNLLADGGEDAHDVGWRSALLERDKKCSRERCP
jgi:hypothetical protein